MMIKVLLVVCAKRRWRQTEQFPKSNQISVSSISRFIAIIYSAMKAVCCDVHCKTMAQRVVVQRYKLYLGLLVGTGVINIMQTDDPHTYIYTHMSAQIV